MVLLGGFWGFFLGGPSEILELSYVAKSTLPRGSGSNASLRVTRYALHKHRYARYVFRGYIDFNTFLRYAHTRGKTRAIFFKHPRIHQFEEFLPLWAKSDSS